MLVDLDETLFHQCSRPFRMAATSDHRFYDRHWFQGVHPVGELAFVAGLGKYKNMGTIDGFFAVQHQSFQHNLRVARSVDDENNPTKVGALEVTVLEPFRRLQVAVAPDEHGLAAELEWRSKFPPYEEAHHLDVHRDRVTYDVTRYDQIGRWNGWIELDGRRFPVEEWWGDRDHSWGTRYNVGGFEPDREARHAESLLWIWACISTDEIMCMFQLKESGSGVAHYLDGKVGYPLGNELDWIPIIDIAHDISFIEGTRQYEHARFQLTLDNGQTVEIEGSPIVRPWAYRGTGYDDGYLDGKGLGARRGQVFEHDIYDLSAPETVVLDGRPTDAGHREYILGLTVDGQPGFGHVPIMTRGKIDRYGLDSAAMTTAP